MGVHVRTCRVTYGSFHVKSITFCSHGRRFRSYLVNFKYPWKYDLTPNLSPQWPLRSELEVILGHAFFPTCQLLNAHFSFTNWDRELELASFDRESHDLKEEWQSWPMTSNWPLTWQGQIIYLVCDLCTWPLIFFKFCCKIVSYVRNKLVQKTFWGNFK